MEQNTNHPHDEEKTMWLSDSSPSHSSGEGDDSDTTPQTPPSPVAVPIPHQLPIVEPHITLSPASSPQKSNRSPKRVTTPKSRLGAIDEDTDKVSPDVPVRDPRRRLGGSRSKLFSLAFTPTLYSNRGPPKRLWDDVKGPHGEKFSDLRNNKNGTVSSREKKRRYICLGLIVLAIGLIVMIVLLAVLLTRRRNNSSNNSDNNNGASSNATGSSAFPVGVYTIASYLTNTAANCTSDPSTWRCYPYITYAQPPSQSLTNISWSIEQMQSSSSSSDGGYRISSRDQLFSYSFDDIALNLQNQGTDNEAYVFTYTYTKSVFPDISLSSDGTRTRCYFNNTLLTGRLYTKLPKQAALANSAVNNQTQWPYALEFEESIGSGDNVPNCYEYVNGENGNRVDVPTLSSTSGQCACQYANYGV